MCRCRQINTNADMSAAGAIHAQEDLKDRASSGGMTLAPEHVTRINSDDSREGNMQRFGIVFVVTLLSVTTVLGSAQKTPWGDPDLQGIWSNQTPTPLERPEATFLFEVIAKRYDRMKPILITSNKSWGAWGEILPDQVMTAAILDRLLHRSITLNIQGESYRLRQHRKAGLTLWSDPKGGDATPS